MKTAKLEQDGFLYEVLLPDDVPIKNARLGVRVGPPDLSSLGLPKEVERRLNNALYHRRLFTAGDVRRRRDDLVGAWQSVLGADVITIAACYNAKD